MNKKIDRVNKFGQKYAKEYDKLKKKGHVLDDGRIIARGYQLMGLQKAAGKLKRASNDALLYENKLKNKYGKNLDVDKKTGKYSTDSYDKKKVKAKAAIKEAKVAKKQAQKLADKAQRESNRNFYLWGNKDRQKELDNKMIDAYKKANKAEANYKKVKKKYKK